MQVYCFTRKRARSKFKFIISSSAPWTLKRRVATAPSTAYTFTMASTAFWHPDPSLAAAQVSSASAAGQQFVVAPAAAADTEQVLKLFAACGVPGFDVAAVREVCNPMLTDGFHSRLAQLQTRSGNPPFRPKYQHEAHAAHREAIVQVVDSLARPFTDPSFPDVSIVPVWHGTSATALPSILNGSFANLASTDSGFFGKGIYGTPDAEYAWRVYASRGGVLLLLLLLLLLLRLPRARSRRHELNSRLARAQGN